MKHYVVETALVRGNLKSLKKRAGSAVLWAVLKGDGYGLGLLPMAQLCAEEGIDHFAVTEVAEAQALRANGFTAQTVLMLRPTCSEYEIRQLLPLNVVFTVSSQEDATVLNTLAGEAGVRAEAHLKIDTGMGRYGFLPEERDKLAGLYAYMKNIHLSGVYTHLHSAFCSKKATQKQMETFQALVQTLQGAGYDVGMVHACNSEALLRMPEYRLDGVRVGSAILGRVRCRSDLKRVGYCEASVEELRWLPAGHTCGYGAGWKAKKNTRIAVFSVGYRHGYSCEYGNDLFRTRDSLRGVFRHLKNIIIRRSLRVTLNGKKCKVLGHVGMLHTVVDVSKVNCALGDVAVFDINPILLRDMQIEYR